MTESRIAHKVAAIFLKRAFYANVPNKLRSDIMEGAIKMARLALSPFPMSSVQREEAKLAQKLFKEMQGSLSMEGAHEFIRYLVRRIDADVKPHHIDRAVQNSLDDFFTPDKRLAGQVDALFREMLQGISQDPAKGSTPGQRKFVKLLGREGVDESSALMLLDELRHNVPLEIKISPSEFNGIIHSF